MNKPQSFNKMPAQLLKGMLFVLLLSLWCVRTTAQEDNISVHDPVMIQQDGKYYLFNTGWGISVWSSDDMEHWEKEPRVFEEPPQWALDAVPGFRGHIWAPDISYHDGTYYLYYSASSFGKNSSCMGLVTNTTLNPEDPDYQWKDQGKVICSVPGRDLWNAIDPNLAFDENGVPWFSFGSFWWGMKLVRLEDDLKTIKKDPKEWHTIAKRERDFTTHDTLPGDAAIEAPFIFKKDDYYYLFVSFDLCCRGEKSTYKVVVGRSKNITGPYVDRDNVKMNHGGGTLVLQGNENWYGVGHNSAYTFDGTDYIVYHGYDAQDEGKPKLLIEEMHWDEEGWPYVTNEHGVRE